MTTTATHLLDTSVFSQRIGRQPHPAAIARWTTVGDARLVVSALTEAEVLYGLEWKASTRLTTLYRDRLHGRLPVLPVDSAVAASYASLRAGLRRAGRTVESMDLLIAATAHAHGLTVATLNHRHFAAIDGLAVEDWSQP